MEKKSYEGLGALQKKIYDFISAAFKKDEYEIKLKGKEYEPDSYVRGSVIFGGLVFECSFNKGGYISWHCDEYLEELIDGVPRLEKTIALKVKTMIESVAKDEREEERKRKIAILEEELKRLKGE